MMKKMGQPEITRRQLLSAGLGLTVAGFGAVALAGCGSSSGTSTPSGAASETMAAPKVKPVVDGDLSWLTWSQYVPEEVVKAFETKYSVKVTQTFFSNPQEYIQKLGAGLPFDLITTNSAYHHIEIAGNLIQSFDWADLKNADNVLPWFQNPFYDNGPYRYTVPYGIGPTGFTYRADKVADVGGKWEDLWSHPDAAGHIYLLDEANEVLSMSLLHNGADLGTYTSDDLKQAVDKLTTLKPSLAGFSSDTSTLMAADMLWMAQTWPTAYAYGKSQTTNPDVWRFVIPSEGAPVAADALSIGANAKAPGTALLFMDWILQPENNAALATFDSQHTGTKSGSEAYLSAVKDSPDLNFTVDSLVSNQKLWKLAPTEDRAAEVNAAWTQLKA